MSGKRCLRVEGLEGRDEPKDVYESHTSIVYCKLIAAPPSTSNDAPVTTSKDQIRIAVVLSTHCIWPYPMP